MILKIKSILISVIIFIFSWTLLTLFNNYNLQSIPDMDNVISITSWNGRVSKKEIYGLLSKKVKEEKVNLVKVRLADNNNSKTKVIYDFNNNGSKNYSWLKNIRLKQLTKKDLLLEDLIGDYYTDASKNQIDSLIFALRKQGLQVSNYHFSFKDELKNDEPYKNEFLIFCSLFGLLFIVIILEKFINYKKYAILIVNGLNIWQIFIRDFFKEIKIYLPIVFIDLCGFVIIAFRSLNKIGLMHYAILLLIMLILLSIIYWIFDLISYLSVVFIKLYSAINGMFTGKFFIYFGYLLKAVLIILLGLNLTTFFKKYTTYQNDKAIMSMWRNKPSGYTVNLNQIDVNNMRRERVIDRKFHKLIEHDKHVIISKNSQQFNPSISDIDIQNGNVIIANANFIKFNSIKYSSKKRVTLNNNGSKLYVFVPKNRLKQLPDFKIRIKKWLKFQRTLPNFSGNKSSNIKLKIIEMHSNQRVFNYTIDQNIVDSVSIDPIIIVVNSTLLSDDFYTSSLSQGKIIFLNLHTLERGIKKFRLQNYVSGITNIKSSISSLYSQLLKELLAITIIMALSLMQVIFSTSYVSTAFFERKKLKLAIYELFGINTHKLIDRFALINIAGDFLIFMLIFTFNGQVHLGPLIAMLVILIMEWFVIYLSYLNIKKNMLKDLNRGN